MKTTSATRSDLSRALAKCLAYRDCGKPVEAAKWAAELVRLLGLEEEILQPEYRLPAIR